MSKSKPAALLLEEPNLRISREAVSTPDAEYPMAELTGVKRQIYKPFLVPLILGVLGTINAVVAVTTLFWGDFLACAVMLGGGIYWRKRGSRFVLRVERNGKMEPVWQTKDEASMDRAMDCMRTLLPES